MCVRDHPEEVPASPPSRVLTFLGRPHSAKRLRARPQPVVVNIGEDLDLLDVKAREVAAVLNTVPEAMLQAKRSPGPPRWPCACGPSGLTQFGFRTGRGAGGD